jgi:hypothetical protein
MNAASPTACRVQRVHAGARQSIYVWFQEDFGGNVAGVMQHLLRYANAWHAGGGGRLAHSQSPQR